MAKIPLGYRKIQPLGYREIRPSIDAPYLKIGEYAASA
jgi:hypothetical protein